MRRLALSVVLLAAFAAAVAGGIQGASAAGGPLVFWSCSPGPDDCGGWYRTSVTISWSAAAGLTGSCPPTTISNDTQGVGVTCVLQAGSSTVTTNVFIKKDATAPTVSSGSAARGPDVNGWYTHPVAVSFSGTDETSGVSSCSSPTYSGPDSATATLAGTCTDEAGNTGSANFTLKYDATPPKVTGATATRPPDANGWFNHPVDFQFTGDDPASGVDSCTGASYKGPDSKAAEVKGSCKDKAGNTSPDTPFTFKYDATAPVFARLTSEIRNGQVVLSWKTSPDVASVVVERILDKRGAKPKVVFKGRGRSWVDKRVKDPAGYRYAVTVFDEAGNRSGRIVRAGRASGSAATPVTKSAPQGKKAPAFLPADGARVHAPVRLVWPKVPKATYYNVQLRRNGVKILSTWPLASSLVIPASWSFGGRAQHLTPGEYRWDVWPGFESRAAAKYGKLLKTSHFTVVG